MDNAYFKEESLSLLMGGLKKNAAQDAKTPNVSTVASFPISPANGKASVMNEGAETNPGREKNSDIGIGIGGSKEQDFYGYNGIRSAPLSAFGTRREEIYKDGSTHDAMSDVHGEDAKTVSEPMGEDISIDLAPHTAASPQSGTGAHEIQSSTQNIIVEKSDINYPPRIRAAMHKAKLVESERSAAVGELRGAEYARLEMLQEVLLPLITSLPRHIDCFECALMPGQKPRLYLDLLSFVELARDRRTYRLMQDTRVGRLVIAEHDRLKEMEEAVVSYIGQRLVEREMLLASLKIPDLYKSSAPSQAEKHTVHSAVKAAPADTVSSEPISKPLAAPLAEPYVKNSTDIGDKKNEHAVVQPKVRSFWSWLGLIYIAAIDILGAITLFGIVIALGVGAWHYIASKLGLPTQ